VRTTGAERSDPLHLSFKCFGTAQADWRCGVGSVVLDGASRFLSPSGFCGRAPPEIGPRIGMSPQAAGRSREIDLSRLLFLRFFLSPFASCGMTHSGVAAPPRSKRRGTASDMRTEGAVTSRTRLFFSPTSSPLFSYCWTSQAAIPRTLFLHQGPRERKRGMSRPKGPGKRKLFFFLSSPSDRQA